jgi:hypothetical protein
MVEEKSPNSPANRCPKIVIPPPIPDVADAGTINMDGAPPPTKQKAPEVMVEQGCGGSVMEINEHDVLIGYQKQKNPGNINFCTVDNGGI